MMQDTFLAKTLRETRTQKGMSQEKIAFELQIARKTVQNWEKGVSEPTIEQTLQWFRVLNISPLPYLFQYVHPKMEGISSQDEKERLKDALFTLMDSLPEEGIRQLLYLFYGKHGSSPRAVMNMITAHLQTPLHDRVGAANVILKNYEMAVKKGEITDPEHIQPDVAALKEALEKGEAAAVKGSECY